jgi:beta-xylosidase
MQYSPETEYYYIILSFGGLASNVFPDISYQI